MTAKKRSSQAKAPAKKVTKPKPPAKKTVNGSAPEKILPMPSAKRAVLELDQAEAQALLGLMDAGVRASGLQAVKGAALLLGKVESACQVFASDPPSGDVPA